MIVFNVDFFRKRWSIDWKLRGIKMHRFRQFLQMEVKSEFLRTNTVMPDV